MKSRTFLVLLFLISSLIMVAQPSTSRVPIPGTTISLIPPKGFLPAGNFNGFQNAQVGAMIVVSEIPSTYSLIASSFSAESLLGQGMELLDKREIDFNNSRATYLDVKQDASGSVLLKQILIFGDSRHTVLVTGMYPEISKSIAQEIKEALLSARSYGDQVVNPLETAKYMINVAGTSFTLASSISGTLAYSADGKFPTDAPSFIVGGSMSNIKSTDHRQYALDRLKKLPRGEFTKVTEVNLVTIDGLEGYEIVADGQSRENKPALVYQTMLFTPEGGYYLLIGQANEDFKTNLELFQRLAKSFKRK
jgi:hypothetical protein